MQAAQAREWLEVAARGARARVESLGAEVSHQRLTALLVLGRALRALDGPAARRPSDGRALELVRAPGVDPVEGAAVSRWAALGLDRLAAVPPTPEELARLSSLDLAQLLDAVSGVVAVPRGRAAPVALAAL